ncbi:glycosyl transferase family 1 [Rhizobium sp. Root708]|uniref:glycosyltransferase n=1 Tax=Rhizobium sp. Root708 TaxID=1736592 RepID=UPI0006FC5F38|nr:glycosyltransferase [Rhizobium sp. Root708]KRB58270.1 glycosyl transferase family 1 [Rhizobium sp. Root708]
MSDAKRVVIATDSLEPSGMGEHMLDLGQGLQQAFDVTFAVMGSDRTGLLPRAARSAMKVKLAADDLEFEDWLRRSGADLLHVHAGIGWEGHELAAAGIACKIPVIRTEHLPYLLTDLEQKRRYLAATDAISHHIAVSEASKASYLAEGVSSERITVVRNGVQAMRPTSGSGSIAGELGIAGKIILLTVARFTPQKDHASLIKAFPEILAAVPAAILLLVGAGEEQSNLEALVEDLGLKSLVLFLGARTDVADLMHAADVFILPSQFEGLPLAVLEAMSAGLPVVATRIGGSVEALGEDHAYFAEPGSARSIAEVVIRALTDADGRKAVGEAGLERFERQFTASRMVRETVDVYRRHIVSNQFSKDHRMTKTRLGFIGVGGIAQRHLNILASFDDIELVAFADPDLDRADAAASRFGAKSYREHREMLDAEELDAAYICIPPFAHGPPEFDLIERRIPFFVEKPLTRDIRLAEDIADKVNRAGLITGVGYHWRYLDTVDEARGLLSDNPAQLLSGYWLDSTPPPQWWWKEEQSGGQMVEQTTHLLDLARFLVGEITEVYGRTGHMDRGDYPGLDVPTVTTANLTFDTGVLANISSTCLLGWSHRVGLHIFADKLAIELNDHEIMVDVGRGRPVRAAEGDPVWREDRDFIDAVRGGPNNIRCPYGDALVTHRLALAVMASAKSGEAVRLPPASFDRNALSPLQFQHAEDHVPTLPNGHRIVRSLGVKGPSEAYLFDYEEGPTPDGQVRLETLYTGLSAGTELTFLKNTNPYFHSRFDGGRGVFLRNEPDLHYPVPFLGYMEVARVAESKTTGFFEGQIVAGTFGHKSGHTADPYHETLIAFPDDIDPILGIFAAQMGPIAANGILHADAEMFGSQVASLGSGIAGRPVIVAGAGPVGFMTALFARKAGASEVVITDPSPFRRGKASAMGLIAMTEDDAWQHAKARWHDGTMGRGADIVFQTRASPESLHLAMKALRPQGTVVDLAFYQGGSPELRLGEEFHHNGLSIKCAQINRVPRSLAASWDRRRLAAETIELLRCDGPSIREHLITQVIPMSDGPAFLRNLIDNRPDFIQVVFEADQ